MENLEFSVPFNCDPKTLKEIFRLNRLGKNRIREIYLAGPRQYSGSGRETPELTRGRNLERGELKDVDCMDKRVTSLSCDTQIGLLRERQKHLNT